MSDRIYVGNIYGDERLLDAESLALFRKHGHEVREYVLAASPEQTPEPAAYQLIDKDGRPFGDAYQLKRVALGMVRDMRKTPSAPYTVRELFATPTGGRAGDWRNYPQAQEAWRVAFSDESRNRTVSLNALCDAVASSCGGRSEAPEGET